MKKKCIPSPRSLPDRQAGMFHVPSSGRSGFTLIEVIVFSAIFVVAVIGITTILVTFTNIEARQSALSEVSGQSQFLLQQIQRYVNAASYIGSQTTSTDMTPNVPTSTLQLVMPSSTQGIVTIYASGTPGVAYFQVGTSSAPQALSSSRVSISNMVFTKHTNAPGHDSVSVSFTVTYNSTNIRQAFTQAIQTAIDRVNAATFDSNVVPSSAGTLTLGDSVNTWNSVNNILYFSGTSVGVNVASPLQMLEVSGNGRFDGGLQLSTSSANPATCNSALRGMIWVNQNAVATDTVKVCLKNGAATYIWAQIY
jgi:type II secretory pathway pseudopilin PulG